MVCGDWQDGKSQMTQKLKNHCTGQWNRDVIFSTRHGDMVKDYRNKFLESSSKVILVKNCMQQQSCRQKIANGPRSLTLNSKTFSLEITSLNTLKKALRT